MRGQRGQKKGIEAEKEDASESESRAGIEAWIKTWIYINTVDLDYNLART